MKSLFDCMIKHSYYANWIVHKLLKKKVFIKRVIHPFYGSRYTGSYISGTMGFYILNFVKTLIRISLRKEKEKEREREREGRSGGREERELILNLFRVRNGNLSAYYVHKSRRCWPQSVFKADKLARLRCYPGKSEP